MSVASVTVKYPEAIAELQEAERLIQQATRHVDRCAMASMFIANGNSYSTDAGDLLKVTLHQLALLRYAFERAAREAV